MKKYFLTPNKIRLISSIIAVAFALPLSWKGLTGLYTWFSPFILLNSVLVLKSFVWINVFGFVVLAFSFVRRRWFCRYMCPVGYGCDLVSKCSPRKSFKLSRVPNFSKWLTTISLFAAVTGLPIFILLDPMALFHGFFSVFVEKKSLVVIVSFLGLPILFVTHLFLPGIWCARICPLGGLQDICDFVKKTLLKVGTRKRSNALNRFGRRFFIASGLGVSSGLLIPRYLYSPPRKYIRPPASLPSNLFNTLCIRCGNCIKTCPTRIIVNHTDSSNLLAWMTPIVHFKNSYCLENCNLCGKVCPSGAITEFQIQAKKEIVMALAVVNLEDCLLTKQSECGRCIEACKYDAMKIKYSVLENQMVPIVVSDRCVGCGACAVICPPLTIEMIPPENSM
ncbi:MAG: 4Fe-4S dicluster domain-containing protein [Fermentimonas sp.]|jgi:ferredoxin-type protein NapF